jgi:hypothetical protein
MAGTIIDSLVVTLGLDSSQYKAGKEDAEKSLKGLQQNATDTAVVMENRGKQAGMFFDHVAGRALAFFAVISGAKGLDQLFTQTVNVGAATGRMALNIGTSVKNLSAWQNALKTAGASADNTTASMNSLAQAQVGARMGDPASIGQLSTLYQYTKIAAFNSDNTPRDPSDIMMYLATWFSTHNAALDQRVGQQIGLTPDVISSMLQLGPAGIKAGLAKDATVDKAQAKALEDEQAAIQQIKIAVQQSATDLAVLGAPFFISAIQDLAAGIVTIVQYITGKGIGPAMANLGFQSAGNFIDHAINGAPLSLHQQPSSAGDVEKRRQAMMDYLIKKEGLTPQQAAGVVGNAMWETGGTLDPESINPKGGAFGLFQWLGSRKKALIAQYGPNPTLDQELSFLSEELHGSEGNSLTALRATSNVDDAATSFNSTFERSGDTGSILNNRVIAAQRVLQQYQQYGAPGVLAGRQHSTVAPQSATGQKVSMNIQTINIHTKATDAKGIASAIAPAIRNAMVIQANTGLT